jgi:hypothetical protein
MSANRNQSDIYRGEALLSFRVGGADYWYHVSIRLVESNQKYYDKKQQKLYMDYQWKFELTPSHPHHMPGTVGNARRIPHEEDG